MSPEEAAAYFRTRPFDRLLRLVRDRFIDLGRAGGNVELTAPTTEELAAIRAFMGPRKQPKRTDTGGLLVPLRDLENELLESKFQCGLREALEAYFGGPLVTKRERIDQEEERWQAFVGRMTAAAPPELAQFVATLRPEWRQGPDLLTEALQVVLRAVEQLPARTGTGERLPVFANRVAGDPHAFDPDRMAGRLLLRSLPYVLPAAADAEAEGEWLALAGLDRDDLSSTVLAVGLTGDDPVVQAARSQGTVLAYPLRTVRELRHVQAPNRLAFVVENPAVFGTLLDRLQQADLPHERWPAIICTSGHLSAAAVRLLDKLIRAGAHLRYSGDFDPGGLRIARGLMRQYGAALSLWRMDARDYHEALLVGGRGLKPAEVRTLEGYAGEFGDLLPAMLMHRQAAYQEALVPQLLADLLSGS